MTLLFGQTSSREAKECRFFETFSFEPDDGVLKHSEVGLELKVSKGWCYFDSQQISGETRGSYV